ncbi:MAG: hypothetical protein KDD98_08405 [Sphingomonadaceae bacterium]|nr:hypothetical protein [Sphingomonadaceae bacterium]
MVGANGDLDVCASLAVVAPLKTGGDGFLSVRARPSSESAELARLKPHHPLAICELSEDERWFGVVYSPNTPDRLTGDCGVLSPIEGPAFPYDGPCESGWVARRYVEMTAG